MTPKPAESVSWWVGLTRAQFTDERKKHQVEMEVSVEGKRGDGAARKNGPGRPTSVPRIRG